MGKSKRFNLVWEKSSRKKPDIWFQRLRRRITRTIGYTVVLFLGLKYLARLFFGESILDAVTDQLETVIYGALKEWNHDFISIFDQKDDRDSKRTITALLRGVNGR